MPHLKVASGHGCVYCLYENNEAGLTKMSARYVGITSDFDTRLQQHQEAVTASLNGSKTAGLNCDRKIASSSKKYTMTCLKHGVASTNLRAWEKHFIALWQTYGGPGGFDNNLAWNETEGG
jgi:hypothetical protein